MKKTDEELRNHKERALSKVEGYIDTLINAVDDRDKSKADKFCYWLEDYIKFLNYEKKFVPTSLRRYKRGEIIKAHLGYNIGSEEGGLHYCVVLDRNNSVNSPVVTVVPLTSVKPTTDINRLHKTSVHLGNELFTNLNSKIVSYKKKAKEDSLSLTEIISKLKSGDQDGVSKEAIEEIELKLEDISQKLKFIKLMEAEVRGMKIGSIALVNQVTTISKIRIYDPKRNEDVLSNIKLSNEKLDMIDEVIGENYSNLC